MPSIKSIQTNAIMDIAHMRQDSQEPVLDDGLDTLMDDSQVDSMPLPDAGASAPSDPSTFETLPTDLPDDFALRAPSPASPPAPPAAHNQAAEMSMSELDRRILELQFLGLQRVQVHHVESCRMCVTNGPNMSQLI